MHIPDGFISGGTTTGFGLASAAGMAASVRYTGKRLLERRVPLAGLLAAFIFAAQMFNFPVLPGMSGHLQGGVLAAVLVGPGTAIVIMAIVLGTQAIFFADGGLTALGLNTFNMGIVGAGAGYAIYQVVLSLVGRKASRVAAAAGIAAGLTVPLAAASFVLQFSLGGAAEVSITAVFAAMVGSHALIGVGEGILTALVVGAVMQARPDLVHGAPAGARERAAGPSTRVVLAAGLLVTLIFAVVVSQLASSNPDGLEFVAQQEGFSGTAQDSPASGSPLADYGAGLTGTDTVDTAVAGLVGVLIVLLIAWGLFRLVRRGERGDPHAPAGGHIHALYRHGTSPLHRLPAHLKLVGGLGLVVALVATPREAVWAFAVFAVVLAVFSRVAGLRPRFLASRMLVEVPFVAVALLLPFFGGGDKVDVLGLTLSEPGLWTMWNILVKGTLGLWAAVILGSTSSVPEILGGLERLRVPRPIIGIAGFMLRYVDVVLGQFGRLRRAMESRAYRPRSVRSSGPLASAVGGLFVRSFERGERVYLAMASRGYTGVMPSSGAEHAGVAQWTVVGVLLAGAGGLAALGWLTR